jgi:outer membrane receptor protein involved in Fe transport
MIKNFTIAMGEVLLFLLIISTTIFAASNGTVRGTIKDTQTKEPLPFSNVAVVGTSWGASSDAEGNYVIQNIPPGKYTLRGSYIGYKSQEIVVEVKEGKVTRLDFKLKAAGIYSDSVVVTAQAEGQTKAINEQLSSLDIKNVVSGAKLQELPDANAAESVSRLPGVSLIRTGGEGAQVVIRGLSPQYNQITIDGVELPSNMASGNNITSTDGNLQVTSSPLTGQQAGSVDQLGDRGEDLSMISSSMLGGIEVIKAITPDMDATLIGGVVNFDMRKAAKNKNVGEGEQSYVPSFQLNLQGGYNDLKNATNDYKIVGQAEERFFNNKLGVFVQASAEQRNLSDNELSANYNLTDKDKGDAGVPDLVSLSIADTWRIRQRYNGTIVLDYQHQNGEIAFMNFISQSKTKTVNREETMYETNSMYYSANETNNNLNIISNLLSIKQDLPIFHMDLKLSHSYSESRNPEDLFFDFYQGDARIPSGNYRKVTPSYLATLVTPNDSVASLDQIQTSNTFQSERTLNAALDLKTSFTLTDYLSGNFKFGGAFQYRERTYDYNESAGSQLYSGGGSIVNAFVKAYPNDFPTGSITLANFAHDGYSYGNFLNGDYKLAYPVNVGLMWKLLPIAKATYSTEGYQVNKLATAYNDYHGNEKKGAVYAMFTLKVGDQITIIPGARYQNLTTTYTAMRGVLDPIKGLVGGDTTVVQSHGYVLPMAHIIYKPFDFLQFHFAYTNTLNYPDYSSITPRYLVGTNYADYNNVRLKPARSENYDLVAAIYNNEIGLLSIGGFKKRIKDLIFFSTTYVDASNINQYPELPLKQGILYQFNTYINNPNPIDVWGIETEWQTHFWYLPEPFNGIVFDINYTHIFSEASYPKTDKVVTYNEDGTSTTAIIDTSYKSRLLNQPDDILNLAIGYDIGGFSARVSMIYQDNIFKHPDFWMQNRTISDKFTRWDISVKQQLPWYNVQIYLDLLNITGAKETDVNQKTNFPAAESSYGMMGDLGIRVNL